MQTVSVSVPASTANMGPGFDALGAALSLRLVVTTSFAAAHQYVHRELGSATSVVVSYSGDSAHMVSTDPRENYILCVASVVAALNGRVLPACSVSVANPIPLGRGLGSSGAAVVAGVVLADLLCDLRLSRAKLLDFAVFFEGHPDNVAPSLLGGFCASYMAVPIAPLTAFVNSLPCFIPPALPDSYKVGVLDLPNIPRGTSRQSQDGGDDTVSTATQTNKTLPNELIKLTNLVRTTREQYLQLLSSLNVTESTMLTKSFSVRDIPAIRIRAVAVIPDFQVPTVKAREVLPKTYSREDVVFTIQRASVLVALLTSQQEGLGLADYLLEPLQVRSAASQSLGIAVDNMVETPNTLATPSLDPISHTRRLFQADFFKGSVEDRIHQNYRKMLVPGLSKILELNDRISSYSNNRPGMKVPEDANFIEGLLGVFMSGAGPTVLALTYDNHEGVGNEIKQIWDQEKDSEGRTIQSVIEVLEIDLQGALLTM